MALDFLIDNNFFFRIESSFFPVCSPFISIIRKKITLNLRDLIWNLVLFYRLLIIKKHLFSSSIKLLLRDYEHKSTLNYYFFLFPLLPVVFNRNKNMFLSLMRIRFFNIKVVLLLIYAFDHCTFAIVPVIFRQGLVSHQKCPICNEIYITPYNFLFWTFTFLVIQC